jgi:hypothetical protein
MPIISVGAYLQHPNQKTLKKNYLVLVNANFTLRNETNLKMKQLYKTQEPKMATENYKIIMLTLKMKQLYSTKLTKYENMVKKNHILIYKYKNKNMVTKTYKY